MGAPSSTSSPRLVLNRAPEQAEEQEAHDAELRVTLTELYRKIAEREGPEKADAAMPAVETWLRRDDQAALIYSRLYAKVAAFLGARASSEVATARRRCSHGRVAPRARAVRRTRRAGSRRGSPGRRSADDDSEAPGVRRSRHTRLAASRKVQADTSPHRVSCAGSWRSLKRRQ